MGLKGGGGWLGLWLALWSKKLKSSWHQRRRSNKLAVNLQRWKGWRGVQGGWGKGVQRGGLPPLLLRCTAVLIHQLGGGGG